MLPNGPFFAGFTSSSAFQYLAIFIVHLNKSRTTPFLLDLSSFPHSCFRDYGCGKATSFDDLFRKDWRVALVPLLVTSTAKIVARLGLNMEAASTLIDNRIKELGDWRGKMLAKIRGIIHEADPEIVEEWKWVKPSSPGTPVFSHGGIVCTGEVYKNVVKITFAKGAALKDPSGLFTSSLDGNVRRAIDIHEGDKIDEAALRDLIGAAVALNLKGRSKPKHRRASSKQAD